MKRRYLHLVVQRYGFLAWCRTLLTEHPENNLMYVYHPTTPLTVEDEIAFIRSLGDLPAEEETSYIWTVGHYAPGGKWMPESYHATKDEAVERTRYLNGTCPRNYFLDWRLRRNLIGNIMVSACQIWLLAGAFAAIYWFCAVKGMH